MSEREAFLKLLAENEDDHVTRLVFADWLDEQGEHEEADSQRKWVAAKDWLVKLCDANNPPLEQADDFGSYVTYEVLREVARKAIESGDEEELWYECRNNRALCNAIIEREAEFWKNVKLVTGTEEIPYDYDPNSGCPGGARGC